MIDFETRDQEYFYSGYWNSNGWKNANNGENLNWNNWSNEETSRYYNSCATIETKSLKFRGNKCQVELYPICYFKDGLTEMQLRGMDIEDTKDIESQFYLVNSTHMIGKTRSYIVFQNNVWHIKSGRKNVFTISGKMVPLGVKEWNKTKGNVRLILHKKVEQPGNFCCDDALCIPSKLVCDTVQNCQDNSDEKNCSKIIFDRNYDNDTPPRPNSFIQVQDHRHYLKIVTRIEIIELISASQNLGKMSLFLKLTLNWYDTKLNLFFLDDDYNNNDINNNVEKKLWTPTIDYMYLKKRRKVFRQLSIQKLSEPKMFGEINIHQPSELYEGSENSIRLEIYDRLDILCMFNQIKDYPFGDDSCYFDIYLDGIDNKWATFDPVILSMLCVQILLIAFNFQKHFSDFTGSDTIGQFSVKSITYNIDFVTKSSTKQVLRITVDFESKFFAVFMVTYLPTILMNILNQATNYLTGDSRHELIITVNITSMMVLASIYLSVSASLRKTHNVKPVEVWLLFNLAYPFFVILVNIVISVSVKL